jgi:polysaccharide export outer membrane protein
MLISLNSTNTDRWLLSIFFVFFLFSCAPSRKAVYFNSSGDNTVIDTESESLQPVIQKNDLLSITISSLYSEASEIFNRNTAASDDRGSNSTGYIVDQDGYIQIQMLGRIKVYGLTIKAIKETITNSLIAEKLLIDPIVNIRYLNFKVTVLGEVGRPNVFTVPSEKISLLEALGLAGDVTIYGRKDNVMVIREEEGKKVIKRFNLNSADLFTSPYYYLKSNDVVYVEPSKVKMTNANSTRQWLPVIITGVSAIIIAVSRFN